MLSQVMDKNNNNKSSFDRFGDDLTELILRYLSLEDQLCLECVSKQFQSCGIQSRTRISSKDIPMLKMMSKSLSGENYLDTNKWLSLMKKCPNVQTIEICWTGKLQPIILQTVYQFLTDEYWPELRQIDCNIDDMTAEDIEFLCQTFPEMIRKVFFSKPNTFNKMKPYLSSMTNLSKLWSLGVDDAFIGGDQLVVNRLRLFSSSFHDNMNNRFNTFIDGNSDLNDLRLRSSVTIASDTVVIPMLSLIWRLQGLRRLDLKFLATINFSIAEPLITIANSCRRLKSFELYMKVDSVVNYMETYNAVKLMKQLKRLNLLIKVVDNNQVIDRNLYTTLKPVNCWPQLIHLKLRLSYLDYQFFTDFNRNLPKLQSLYINCPIELFDWTCMSFISKLKTLATVSIHTKNDILINESDVLQVINGCPKLKQLIIYNEKTDDLSYDEITIQSLRTTTT